MGRTQLLLQKADAAIAIADHILSEHTNHFAAGILKVQALIIALRFKEALTLIHHLMANHTITDELLFYKVEVLLEGNINIDEAGKLLVELKEKSGIDFIKNKLGETHVRFRPQHGNDNFFVAQVYKILSDDFSTEDALQQAEQALQEKVHFEGYEYPHGVIYELKARCWSGSKTLAKPPGFITCPAKNITGMAITKKQMQHLPIVTGWKKKKTYSHP